MNKKENSFTASVRCFNFIGIGNTLMTAYLIVLAANIINLLFGKAIINSENFGGLISGLSTMTAFTLCGFPMFVAGITESRYNLLCFMPMKASTVPLQMVLAVDVLHLMNAVTEVIIMLATGNSDKLVIKLAVLLFLYINAHVVLLVSVSPNLRRTDSTKKQTLAGVAMFFIVIISVIAVVIASVAINDDLSEKALDGLRLGFSIATGVLAVGAVIARALTYRQLKRKIRLIKVYKEKNVKAPAEYQYV